uniref:uncharacterized protein LOC124001716 isoform X2 n=1 Tax=Oncorhynchus gorbuscha TaxID=8017 RepID=UPI001EAEF56F|nr:uncharacterized protein LOC124001716 isoform X2 [Oncorhynchus gorbuscha]
MGSTESAQQREDSRKCDDEEAKADEEESANNLQDGETPDAKLLQKNGQMSGLSEKAAGKIEVVNGLCEDKGRCRRW